MIALTYCMHRLPHLTHAQFTTYWYEQHAPLVRRHAEVLRVRRYVQLHAMDSELNRRVARFRRGPEPFDGIAQLWYDSREAFEAAAADPAAQAAVQELLQDERRFIDLARSPVWLNDIREVVSAGAAAEDQPAGGQP